MIKLTSPDTYTASIDGTEWSGITPASRFWPSVQEMIASGAEVVDETQPRVPTLEQERRGMVCSPLQGILTLGEANWTLVTDYRDNVATWSEKVVIDSALDWRRNSQNIAFFQYLLGFTDEQTDELFRVAMTVEA